MDFNKMVNDSLVKMEKEGEVQKLIDKHVASTVDTVVKDLFGMWSDFSDELKNTAKEALQINFKDLELASYNHMILQAIKDKLDDEIKNNGVMQIKGQIESLLTNPKHEYRLSELIDELAEEIEGVESLDYEEYREMSLHVEKTYSSYFIHMDAEEDMSKYRCKYTLHISESGELYSVGINDQDEDMVNNFDTKRVMSGLYGLEETLFKIYTSKAKIIIDESNCKLERTNPEYEWEG
ncbi:hypothetical protein GPA34_12410 [Listeria monocytogenes]|nr:hypothetical protein [Listeria monocytogenes]EAE1602438.1 hypothetical protein [Listeria monocytogenes]EAE9451222.1 hypothetical protein [Listeria monocytogenes]EAG2064015.1 hypothetical protein [Listeria monocytogenes]EAG4620042.1 hypothetical protein [Listeria monocytogenes]